MTERSAAISLGLWLGRCAFDRFIIRLRQGYGGTSVTNRGDRREAIFERGEFKRVERGWCLTPVGGKCRERQRGGDKERLELHGSGYSRRAGESASGKVDARADLGVGWQESGVRGKRFGMALRWSR